MLELRLLQDLTIGIELYNIDRIYMYISSHVHEMTYGLWLCYNGLFVLLDLVMFLELMSKLLIRGNQEKDQLKKYDFIQR